MDSELNFLKAIVSLLLLVASIALAKAQEEGYGTAGDQSCPESQVYAITNFNASVHFLVMRCMPITICGKPGVKIGVTKNCFRDGEFMYKSDELGIKSGDVTESCSKYQLPQKPDYQQICITLAVQDQNSESQRSGTNSQRRGPRRAVRVKREQVKTDIYITPISFPAEMMWYVKDIVRQANQYVVTGCQIICKDDEDPNRYRNDEIYKKYGDFNNVARSSSSAANSAGGASSQSSHSSTGFQRTISSGSSFNGRTNTQSGTDSGRGGTRGSSQGGSSGGGSSRGGSSQGGSSGGGSQGGSSGGGSSGGGSQGGSSGGGSQGGSSGRHGSAAHGGHRGEGSKEHSGRRQNHGSHQDSEEHSSRQQASRHGQHDAKGHLTRGPNGEIIPIQSGSSHHHGSTRNGHSSHSQTSGHHGKGSGQGSHEQSSETEDPNSESEGTGGGGCFGSGTTVETTHGPVRMDQLKVDDLVLAYNTMMNIYTYEPVVSFIHREPERPFPFIVLGTASGNTIAMTSEHLLPILDCNQTLAAGASPDADRQLQLNAMQPARMGAIGKCILAVKDGKSYFDQISSVSIEQQRGIYAPLTKGGYLVVNGVHASCYSEMENSIIAKPVINMFLWAQSVFESAQKMIGSFINDENQPISEELSSLVKVMIEAAKTLKF